MYNIGKYMKKIISCGKRSVNKTGPNLHDKRMNGSQLQSLFFSTL